MSHSTVLVILPDAKVAELGLDEALSEALDPFDENRETPQYIRLTKAEAIAKERESIIRYRDQGLYAEYMADPVKYEAESNNPQHIEYLKTGFPEKLTHLDDEDWLYKQATEWENVDEEGNIVSTRNPNSKWDWWAIGGRWSGRVLNTTETIEHPEEKRTEQWITPAWTEHTGGEDIVQKQDLTAYHGTFAVLTAAGEWHEAGRMGWFGMITDEKDPNDWDAQAKALVEAADPEDWLVVVDVHI